MQKEEIGSIQSLVLLKNDEIELGGKSDKRRSL
jgi:hypothetical protein